MRIVSRLILIACGLGWALTAQAEIYKFIDDQGNVTYSNVPRPGAKKLELDVPPPAVATPKEAATGKKPRSRTASPSPAYFPRVDPNTQRRRDDMRRQLLLEELASEQRNLDAARRALATAARQPGAEINKLADSVRLHENNIQMLNKELSLIR
ncbi:MAG: DUF4124 domain-containing protein [Thiobacillaceae bacterium]